MIKLIKEDINKFNQFIEQRVPSKFDKWLGYDFGDVRANAGEREYTRTSSSFNFVGRQRTPKGLMYLFYDEINQDEYYVRIFDEVAKYIMLPGRKY